ncbi:MAG: ribonuclease J, partial [Traorella sp.]
MDQIRICALGGLDENGKNMLMVEVNSEIILIEAGIKFPESDQLGIEFIIPDFNYLIENKNRIKGVFVTHGHDDISRALPYLIKHINVPIYTGAMSANVLRDLLKSEEVKDFKINKVKRTDKLKVGNIHVRTFAMSHAYPDNFGIAIATDQGYVVYTGEFIIDYDMNTPEYDFDINELSEIGKEGVLCLMSESLGADKEGHTSPFHRISPILEPIIETSNHRILISCYSQSLFRMREILDLAIRFRKKVYFYGDEARYFLKHMEDLNYYHFPKELVVNDRNYDDADDDIIVLITGRGKNLFRKIQKIAMHEDEKVHFRTSDTIIIASAVVSGTEVEANAMENEIYKEGGQIYSLNSKKILSLHPSSEDLKMMLYLFKPRYYIPVKGEYRHLITNANLAFNMGYRADQIIILDNGQFATFENKFLKSVADHIELEDTMIDGKENWDVTGVVLKDREILSNEGVMVIGVSVDFKTKQIIGGVDVQTRG